MRKFGRFVALCALLTSAECTSFDASGIAGPGDAAVSDGAFLDTSSPGCQPGTTECSDCADNDGDGLIDGFDPGCTSAQDRLEDSFATGIPGDNLDSSWQDCFFDGDTGAANDGCNQHTCCILGAPDPASCPISANQYDPAECDLLSQECIDVCEAITPPGCDCFGCCTECNDTGCYDVYIHPIISPNCDVGVLSDPSLCAPCAKSESCGTPCEPTGCTLCPGQTENDLPPDCVDNTCPEGLETCDAVGGCAAGYFCANGCCIYQIP